MSNNTKQKTCCNQNCDQGRKCPERKESRIIRFVLFMFSSLFFSVIANWQKKAMLKKIELAFFESISESKETEVIKKNSVSS